MKKIVKLLKFIDKLLFVSAIILVLLTLAFATADYWLMPKWAKVLLFVGLFELITPILRAMKPVK